MSNVSPPTTMRGKIVYFIWNNIPRFILLAMVVLIFVLMGSIREQSKIIAADKAAAVSPEKPKINVITLTLSPTTITNRINLPGSIEPWTKLRLMSKLSGTVVAVLVKEGDHIKQGDILARIEATDYQIALTRSEAAYNLAKAEYKRDKTMYDKGVIATSALDTKKTRLQTAKADYENARLLLSRTTVTSPMDGVIRSLNAKVGLQLSIGAPIAEILEIDRLKGVVGIPESDVSAVRTLDSVDVTIQALNNKKVTAKKYFLSPSPENIARLYSLELEINNRDGEILAGMFIRADIIKEQADNILKIPFYSVISRNSEQYVYIEENGIAKKKDVTLGIMEKWMVQVTSGLHNGDKVIIEGHRDVENGQKVKIVKALTSTEELKL